MSADSRPGLRRLGDHAGRIVCELVEQRLSCVLLEQRMACGQAGQRMACARGARRMISRCSVTQTRGGHLSACLQVPLRPVVVLPACCFASRSDCSRSADEVRLAADAPDAACSRAWKGSATVAQRLATGRRGRDYRVAVVTKNNSVNVVR
jgi:hypothetical protein